MARKDAEQTTSGLLAAVVGGILQKFLADPGFTKSHGVSNQHAVVA